MRGTRGWVAVVGLCGLACGSTDRAPTPRAEPAGPGTSTATPTETPTTTPEPDEPSQTPEPPSARAPSTARAPDAFLAELDLPSASHRIPAGAPDAIVHAPPNGATSGPMALVIFLHGWSGCTRVLALSGEVACREESRPFHGWNLSGVHERAGTDTVLVVAQLAWMRRTGHPGRFAQPGFFDDWLEALLAALSEQDAHRFGSPARTIGSITLVAHSAGYESALAILRHGAHHPIVAAVMMDALYGRASELGGWVSGADDRRVLSLYTGGASTRRESRALARLASEALGPDVVADASDDTPLAELFTDHRVVVRRSPHPHGAIPIRQLPEVLRALPLPRLPAAP